MDHSSSIAAYGGYGEVLLHLGGECTPAQLTSAAPACGPFEAPVPCPTVQNDPRIKRMFAGSLVALVTPMQPSGAIDYDAWSRLLEFHLANGTSGVVVAGSTGESATVTDDELAKLLLEARRVIGRRVPLIANTGTIYN
jgi:hypothetical protein